MATCELVVDRPLDLRRTLSIHHRGSGDPTMPALRAALDRCDLTAPLPCDQ